MNLVSEFEELTVDEKLKIRGIIDKKLGDVKKTSTLRFNSIKWYNNFMDKFHEGELEDCLTLQIELNEDNVLKGGVLKYCELMKKSWTEINKLNLFTKPNDHYNWILKTLRQTL